MVTNKVNSTQAKQSTEIVAHRKKMQLFVCLVIWLFDAWFERVSVCVCVLQLSFWEMNFAKIQTWILDDRALLQKRIYIVLCWVCARAAYTVTQVHKAINEEFTAVAHSYHFSSWLKAHLIHLRERFLIVSIRYRLNPTPHEMQASMHASTWLNGNCTAYLSFSEYYCYCWCGATMTMHYSLRFTFVQHQFQTYLYCILFFTTSISMCYFSSGFFVVRRFGSTSPARIIYIHVNCRNRIRNSTNDISQVASIIFKLL